jgi:hypothetical protein
MATKGILTSASAHVYSSFVGFDRRQHPVEGPCVRTGGGHGRLGGQARGGHRHHRPVAVSAGRDGGGPHPRAPGQASVGEVHWQGLPTGRSSGPYRESSGGEGPGRLPPGLGQDSGRHPLVLRRRR